MDLNQIRQTIDEIDEQMVALFGQRMELVRDVAEYKRQNNLPVLHKGREAAVLDRVAALAGKELAESTRFLFTTMMDLSKAQQYNQLAGASAVGSAIEQALAQAVTLPHSPAVACQGVDGAYSSLAARGMFPQGSLHFYKSFEDVFCAVKNGECEIGVLPIENSTAGSVNNVYDLMRRHRFHIVRGIRQEVSHCLLAKHGVALEEITDIYSHEQAISQCEDFLRAHPEIRVHLYSNTAAAARFVGECGDRGVAAIASAQCAGIYDLNIVMDEIKSAQKNDTRFIAICNTMILTEDSNKLSVSLTLPHETGSLYRLITQFAMQQLNLTKLESRPLPNTNFEFLFYFDFDGNVRSDAMTALLARLEQQCDYFEFLGNYREL